MKKLVIHMFVTLTIPILFMACGEESDEGNNEMDPLHGDDSDQNGDDSDQNGNDSDQYGDDSDQGSAEINNLEVLQEQYPKALFFRGAEKTWKYNSYEEWINDFSMLSGFVAKAMNENTGNTPGQNKQWFRDFKKEYPDQIVVLHFTGRARRPKFKPREKVFSGHWIYRTGTKITQTVPADKNHQVIHVEDPSLFRVYPSTPSLNDDVVLFGIKKNGKYDWDHSEHVKILSKDVEAGTITVNRAKFGTNPRRFYANESRAVAHYNNENSQEEMSWIYNLSTKCPKDKQGKTFSDRLVQEIGGWFDPDGPLGRLDGIEFDALWHITRGDTDGDGKEDAGFVDGVNEHGIGVTNFIGDLRERLGPNRLIMADAGDKASRAASNMNGVELEGFPNCHDSDLISWSESINDIRFFTHYAAKPKFTYLPQRVNEKADHTNWSWSRAITAASTFTGAAVAQHFDIRKDPDGGPTRSGISDELWGGTLRKKGYLGAPTGPAVHMAKDTTDLLDGDGLTPGVDLLDRFSGEGVTIEESPEFPGALQISADGKTDGYMNFTLHDVPVTGKNLFVAVKARAKPSDTYGGMPRAYWTYASSKGRNLLRPDLPKRITYQLRGEKEEDMRTLHTHAETGSKFQMRTIKLGKEAMTIYYIKPPVEGLRGAGSVNWYRTADIRKGQKLRFMQAVAQEKGSDGVEFAVYVAKFKNDGVGDYELLWKDNKKNSEFQKKVIDLDSYAGKKVKFRFVTDCGPRDNCNGDFAYWADVRIVERNNDTETHMLSHMSYAKMSPFESTFFYSHINKDSGKVNINFTVEESAPFIIESITAHAAPDLMYREFENGLVLANPSQGPAQFDLSVISPDTEYKRIMATVNQDRKVNDGSDIPMNSTIRIPATDALFLLKR